MFTKELELGYEYMKGEAMVVVANYCGLQRGDRASALGVENASTQRHFSSTEHYKDKREVTLQEH